MKWLKLALSMALVAMLFVVAAPNEKDYTLTLLHPNGEVLYEEGLKPGSALPSSEQFLDDEVFFQGYYESSSLEKRHDDKTMPRDDLMLYAAYTNREGFMRLSTVPNTIEGVDVKARFGTNRQGFVRVGSSLHYIGGVGPHLTSDEGDFSGFDYITDLHIVYDLETHTWKLMPDLPAKIGFLDAVAYQESIYILGGQWADDEKYLKQKNLRYDIDTKTYHTIADPPFDFQATNGSVLHEGRIYVFNGTKQTFVDSAPTFEGTNETLIYDIESDSWQLGDKAPFQASSGSAALIDNAMYVYRSTSSSDSHFAKYDPYEDTWEDGLEVPEHHVSHSSSTQYRGKLLVSGGWKTGITGTSGAIQVYDTLEDNWQTMTDLKAEDGGGIGYVAQYYYDDSLYFMGGESHNTQRLYESHYGIYQMKEEWITP